MVSSSGAKGGIGLFFGMAIGSVGIDQVTGVNRLMFGQWQLSSGIGLTAFLMGLFASVRFSANPVNCPDCG